LRSLNTRRHCHCSDAIKHVSQYNPLGCCQSLQHPVDHHQHASFVGADRTDMTTIDEEPNAQQRQVQQYAQRLLATATDDSHSSRHSYDGLVSDIYIAIIHGDLSFGLPSSSSNTSSNTTNTTTNGTAAVIDMNAPIRIRTDPHTPLVPPLYIIITHLAPGKTQVARLPMLQRCIQLGANVNKPLRASVCRYQCDSACTHTKYSCKHRRSVL
jgi:hypothetical protein